VSTFLTADEIILGFRASHLRVALENCREARATGNLLAHGAAVLELFRQAVFFIRRRARLTKGKADGEGSKVPQADRS